MQDDSVAGKFKPKICQMDFKTILQIQGFSTKSTYILQSMLNFVRTNSPSKSSFMVDCMHDALPVARHGYSPGVPEELLYLDVLRLVVGCRKVLQHLGPAHYSIIKSDVLNNSLYTYFTAKTVEKCFRRICRLYKKGP